MVKDMYQISSRTKMKLLHSYILWSKGVDLRKKYFTYLEGLDLYRKWVQNVDDIWNNGRKDFVILG